MITREETRFVDIVSALVGQLPSELARQSAAATLQTLARRLPRHGSSVGAECRLAPRRPIVDLGVSIGRTDIAGWLRAEPWPEVEAWRAVRRFGKRWAADSSLQRWIPFLFLELDARTARYPVPVPSIFLSLDWPIDGLGNDDGVTRQAAATALSLLLADDWPRRVAAHFDRAMDALPRAGRVLHVGAMLGRRSDVLRLSIALPREDVRAHLLKLGWHHWTPVCGQIVRALIAPLDAVHVEIDVGDEVGSRLGFVLTARQAPNAPGWSDLFAWLTRRGLCSASKGAAVLAWPGVGVQRLRGKRSMLARRAISHLKVTVSPNADPQAKAYLTLTRQRAFG